MARENHNELKNINFIKPPELLSKTIEIEIK